MDTKISYLMSGLSKALMLDLHLLEKSLPLNFSKKHTVFQAKQLKKLFMEKKVKTIFSAQQPLKIRR